MKSIDKFVLVLVASLALLLAGCGGGSSTQTPTDPPPDPGPTAAEMQYSAVDGAIVAAGAAVAGLTAMSSDADVAAAKAAIAEARTALNGANLLSANQVNALDNRLDDIDGDLVTAEASIAEHRQMVADNMMNQRNAANTAIQAAMDAVSGLSNTSTDAEVTAAKDAIQDAKDAVAAATALSMADRDSLTGRISMIETTLASTEMNIAEHRQMVADDNQRMGVSDAIAAAMTAVEALSATSSDEEVTAAEGLIQAAKDALNGATSVLTAAKALEHSNSIAMIEMTLSSTKTAIADHREQVDNDNETQRMADVSSARSEAMTSYMAADGDATKAEAQADAAEETAPGSAGAVAARAAADAAREAANAAKAAHDAIMDDMTKEEADAEAAKAATAASNANSSYMTAMTENNRIQDAKAVSDEQQRMADIEDAQEAANAAKMAAETAKTDADTAATAAENAQNAAHAAYMKAIAARTDSTNAKAEYEKAKTAATEARTAANHAETAYMAAKMAAEGIDADGTAEAAQMAQMTAETEQGKAETAQMTAETEQGKAETAEMDAVTAAGTHVLRLFQAANGEHVMDGTDEGTSADEEKATHVRSVGAAMAAIAAATDGAQAAGTTATITFPGDTVDDPGTVDDPATLETVENNEFAEGMLGITVNVAGTTEIGGTAFELRESKAAMDLNNDGDMTDEGEPQIIQTARKIDDLGVFDGYELWENDDDATTNTDRARAILFTNKQKGDDSVLAVTAATARSVENVAVDTTTLTMLGTKSGNTYTGAEYTPSGESALTGTLTCPSGVTCSVDATTAADGTVTINAVSGYVFTGSRAAREEVAAAAATENNNYLAFGLWIEESDDGATDTFGAFAVGGTGYAVGAPADSYTGTATYSGNAAGAHHKTGEGVNWFHGDARLTANFGAADTAGSISGAISNIRVNGGAAMSDSIYLGEADLTAGTATFNGAAFMGAATAPGASTHEFDGTWSGSFFGATANDADTTDVDESITAPLATAGTFGVTKSMGTGDDMMVESFVGAFGAHKD